jgi:hypothetical protein
MVLCLKKVANKITTGVSENFIRDALLKRDHRAKRLIKNAFSVFRILTQSTQGFCAKNAKRGRRAISLHSIYHLQSLDSFNQ